MILSRKNLKNTLEGLKTFRENCIEYEEPFRSNAELKRAIPIVEKAIEKKIKIRPKE